MKILFICAANVNRSPTFERWFKANTDHEVRSAGTFWTEPYGTSVKKEDLAWADRIYVMDLSQKKFIDESHHEFISKVEVVGISDQYEPDSEELIELIEYWWKK